MEWAVLLLLVLLLTPFLVASVALLVALRVLRKRNRVVPDVATTAPTTWAAGHPGAGARLHRRLRSAVAAARAACASAPMAPRLAELTAELEQEAVVLDHQVVAAAMLAGRERRVRLSVLAGQVRQVEQVASQVSLLSAQAQSSALPMGQPSALESLARQLDAMEQARTEVAEAEAAAGLHRPGPFATAPDQRGTASPGA